MDMKTTRTLMTLVVALLLSLSATPLAHAASTPRGELLGRINQARSEHGLSPVYPSTALHVIAEHHSNDMLSRDYFAHTSPSGSTLYDRIVNSGFVAGYGSWTGGETLAWGTGSLGTPAGSVRAWLNSPDHRAILLSTTYKWIGISRACGTFQNHQNACVWTADWVKR
jgi:uncharacterized protein YkwD